MPLFPNIWRIGLTFDLNINRESCTHQGLSTTKFEASESKRSWVRCWRLTWPLTLTWISIGIIFSSRNIYRFGRRQIPAWLGTSLWPCCNYNVVGDRRVRNSILIPVLAKRSLWYNAPILIIQAQEHNHHVTKMYKWCKYCKWSISRYCNVDSDLKVTISS